MNLVKEISKKEYTLEVIAKNIKHFRTIKNMSQTELGLRSGITPGYITDIERCRHDIMISTLTKIAAGLEIELYELFVENRKQYFVKSRVDKNF